MSALGSLIVKLALEYAEYTKGLDKGEQEALQFAKKVQGHMDTMAAGVKGLIGGMAAGLAGAFSVGAIINGLQNVVHTMGEVTQASQQLGIATERLVGMKLAAELAGISFDDLVEGMAGLSEQASAGKETFGQMGIKLKDTNGHLKGLDTLLYEIADAFEKSADGTAKAAIAQDIMGDAGLKLIPLLNTGAAGMKAFQEQAEQLGLTFDANTGKAAKEFGNTLKLVGMGFEGVYTQVVAKSLPALQGAAEAFMKATSTQEATTAASQVLTFAVRAGATAVVSLSAAFRQFAALLTDVAAGVIEIAGGIKDAFVAVVVDTYDMLKGLASAMAMAISGNLDGAADEAKRAMLALGNGGNEAAARIEWGFRLMGEGAKSFVRIGSEAGHAIEDIWTNTGDGVAKMAAATAQGKKQLGDLNTDAKKEMEGLLGEWAGRITALNAASAATQQLTASEQAYQALQTKLTSGASKLSDKQQELVLSYAAVAVGLDKANVAKQTAVSLSEKMLDSARKEADDLKAQIKAEREKGEAIGLSASQVADLEDARMRLTAAEKDGYAAALESAALYAGEYADAYRAAAEQARKQAAELRELAGLRLGNAMKQEAADAAKAAADEWRSASEQIRNDVTDALMRGFEAGEGFVQNLIKTTRNYLKSAALRVAVQAVVTPVMGGLGLLNAAQAGQAGGSAVGPAGYVNTASSAYNVYSAGSTLYTVGAQYAAGTMSAANAAGTLYANATAAAYGDGLTALLATNGAYGTAAGAGAAAGGAAAAEGAAAGSAAAGGSSMMGSFAAAGPYAIAALVIANALGLFRTTKQVGGGLLGTVGDTTDIQAYDLMRKSGTLFSGPDYSYSTHAADPALVQAISAGVGSVLSSTRAQAGAIGVGGNIASFTGTLGTDVIHPDTGGTGIKLDGLTGEQAQQKVAEAIGALAEKAAAQALGSAGEVLARSGETAVQTLTRLSSNITSVNGVMHALGESAMQASLNGAAAAQRLVDAFGGTEALASAAGAYYDAIYSDSEKLSLAQQHLQESFSALGQVVPENAAALKVLVDAQDRGTESGTAMWAGLVKLGPAYAEVQQAIEEQAAKSKEAAAAERERAQAVAAGLAARSRADTPASMLIAAQQAAAEFSDAITKMLDAADTQGQAAYALAWEAAAAMGKAQAGWMLASAPLTGMALEMEKIRANAAAMRPALIALYGGTYQPDKIIAKGIAQQTAALKSGFMSDVTDQLLQLTDASAYAAKQLKEEQAQRLADAKALGLSAAEIAKVTALHKAQTSALQEEASAWKASAASNLRGWLDGQQFSATSSLDPGRQFQAAQQQFAGVVAAARGKDQAALDRVTSVADTLLSTGRGMYGSGSQYVALEAMTRRTVESLGRALDLPGFSLAEQKAEQLKQTAELQRQTAEMKAQTVILQASNSELLKEIRLLRQRVEDLERPLRLATA